MAILGSGDLSRSLAVRLVASGVRVVVGSRYVNRISSGLFPDAVELRNQEGQYLKQCARAIVSTGREGACGCK